MNPDSYWYILPGSLSGGLVGVLVMWNRKRLQIAGDSGRRSFAVLSLGTAASAASLWAFNRAFGANSSAFAALVVTVMTNWAAVLQPVLSPLMPWSVLRVRAGEFALLRRPWSGVRLFGEILRRTPLRHLGGGVYFGAPGQDARSVLCAIRDAETVHLAGWLLCCPWLVIWTAQQLWVSILFGLAVQVPLNIYPILHLRHATWRIERYLARSRKEAFIQPVNHS